MKRFLLLLCACLPESTTTPAPAAWIADTSVIGPPVVVHASIADRYREVGGKIIAAAHADRGAYKKLAELTDRVGHRFSGSPELDKAIRWAVQSLKDDGFDVHTEAVMVPHWVRGAEDGDILGPNGRPLHLLGLGGSVATPKGGITAPVVVVHDWAELAAKRDAVKGAIVLYDVPMPAWTLETGPGYGKVVEYRTQGAMRAGKLGAVATLMRSVTEHSLRTPHTGQMGYDDGPRIPSAAVTVEDATLLARLAAAGPVSVHLRLDDQMLPDAESANVIGELRGTDKADEIVLIGAHLDSWDVGQGAHDDGAGVATMMETLVILKKLGLAPHRTIRVVLYTNEENGGRGGIAYAKEHASELARTVLALESDSGGFAPRGFGTGDKPELLANLTDLASLLAPIHATRVTKGHGEADIAPLAPAGVPLIGLDVDSRTYFDYHHTESDTLDKVDPQQLADDVAAVALVAYIAADLPGRLDQ